MAFAGPKGRLLEKSRPTVGTWCMTHISSEEVPCRPKGTTFKFQSNWPCCDRKLVLNGPRPEPAGDNNCWPDRVW